MPKLLGARLHVGEHVPLGEQLQMATGHGRAQRVPRERVPVVQRQLAQVGAEERVEHRAARDGGRHRQVAAGQPFADAHQVGP